MPAAFGEQDLKRFGLVLGAGESVEDCAAVGRRIESLAD